MTQASSGTDATTIFADQSSISRLVWPERFDVCGVQVSSTNYEEITRAIIQAASQRQSAVVACHAVHAIVTASQDAELRHQVNSFEAITPDGQPVRWALNWLHRIRLKERVYGPELMLRVCQAAAEKGISIYLYGGTPHVLDELCRNLNAKIPGLQIAGSEAPPFRELTDHEATQAINKINDSGAGIVFIGLGCPKQDRFAFRRKEQINAVQLCVGAAFDFHAGVKSMAPEWMQRNGLEWLFRLSQEPKRLWKRYLVTNSVFIMKVFAQTFSSSGKRDG